MIRDDSPIDLGGLFLVFAPAYNEELTVQGHLGIANSELFVLHELFAKPFVLLILAKINAD
jgi:hypothetical protein